VGTNYQLVGKKKIGPKVGQPWPPRPLRLRCPCKHTEQVKKLCMDLSWHALNSTLQAKTLYHTEKQGLGNSWQKNPDKSTKTR